MCIRETNYLFSSINMLLIIWALSFVNKADWLQISVFVIRSCYCLLGYGILAYWIIYWFFFTELFTDK